MSAKLPGLTTAPVAWKFYKVVTPPVVRESKPYSLLVSTTPKLGHAPEARSVLSDFTQHVQSLGTQSTLVQQVWGSDGSVLTLQLSYDSLGEADESRLSITKSAEYGKFLTALTPHMADYSTWEVNERVAASNV
jgi:hypothetical protein